MHSSKCCTRRSSEFRGFPSQLRVWPSRSHFPASQGRAGCDRGSCLYAGTEVRRWRRREFAKRVSFLPQTLRLEFPFTAEQVIFMGRTPYAGGWFESPEDHEAVARAMNTTETLAFR